MQNFFTIFASPEVKNRSNTSHYVFSKPKMDKKQKKSLRRHLLVIYIFYFLALAAGFIHSFVPHVSSSLATGWQAASEDIRMQEKHGIAQHTYFLAARLQNDQSDETLFPIETGHASISTEADAHTLEEILAAKEQGLPVLEALMLPVESVFESLPLLVVEPWVEQHLYNGCPTSRYPAADGRYRVRNAAGQFLGLANIVQGVLRVEKLFIERN